MPPGYVDISLDSSSVSSSFLGHFHLKQDIFENMLWDSSPDKAALCSAVQTGYNPSILVGKLFTICPKGQQWFSGTPNSYSA